MEGTGRKEGEKKKKGKLQENKTQKKFYEDILNKFLSNVSPGMWTKPEHTL